jgi:uncharacterized sporulation protein YeaH/YhbH (DUF444 family)
MFGLQLLLNPKAAKAIEVQQDLRHGYYNKKRVPGEGDGEEAADDNIEVDPSGSDRDDKDLSASGREESGGA